MKKILLFGAGRGSRDILQLIKQINSVSLTWEILGFVDSNSELKGKIADGYPVFGKKYPKSSNETIYGITGVQIPRIRRRIIESEIEANGFCLATLIHPAIEKPMDFKIGEGSVIFPGVIITLNVKLGKGVIVNYNTLLGIDLVVGDYTFIGPLVNITASCSIGNECIIGASSVFVPGVSVGNGSVIGLGTKLFSSVGDNKSVIDMPRKIIRDIDSRPQRVSW